VKSAAGETDKTVKSQREAPMPKEPTNGMTQVSPIPGTRNCSRSATDVLGVPSKLVLPRSRISGLPVSAQLTQLLQDFEEVLGHQCGKKTITRPHNLQTYFSSKVTVSKRGMAFLLDKLVEAKSVEGLAIFMVLLNTGYTLYDIHRRMQHESRTTSQNMRIIEEAFTWAYCTELILKLMVCRLNFFLGEDVKWNVADLILVLLGLLNKVVPVNPDGYCINPLFILIMRVLKVLHKSVAGLSCLM